MWRTTLAALAALLELAPHALSADWFFQHPVPQGNTLRAAALGPESLIAVGDYGTIVRLDRKTGAWQQVPSPASHHLRAIAFAGETTWIAVGLAGAILRSTDSGSTWAAQAGGSTEDLYGLAFSSSGTGLAVGTHGAMLLTTNKGKSWVPRGRAANVTLRAVAFLNAREAVAGGESGVMLRTDDDGATWQQSKVKASVYAIAARGDDAVAVGGDPGYFWNSQAVFSSRDHGRNWKVELDGTGPVLYGISIGEAGTAVACGESGALWRRAGRDSAWTKLASPVKLLLATVIHMPEGILAGGSYGTALTSKDGGQSWTANRTERAKEFYSISFSGAAHGVAVGEDGRILYTADGGRQWELPKAGFKAVLSGVSMLSPTTAVAVGGEGLIVRTTDGGQSWTKVPSGTDLYLGAVGFADEHSGLAVGYSTILATGDGGQTWERRLLATGVGDCTLRSVAYRDRLNVVLVGSLGVIVTSPDGGRNWTYRRSGNTQHLFGVAWSDAQHATAVGVKGTMVATADGGQTWAAFSSGVTELLTSVAFLNEREGFASGEFGVVLATHDGGKTWMRENSHTQNHLRSLFCRPGAPVVAAGWNGTILRRTPNVAAEKR
jgi:photosystem II stability/assembly factor-like uncharacterized protein